MFRRDLSINGPLLGSHIQNPKQQGKLVTVLYGSMLDVAVDVRAGSPTFGQSWWNLMMRAYVNFGVPRGFAHGFVVQSDTAVFLRMRGVFQPVDVIVTLECPHNRVLTGAVTCRSFSGSLAHL
jgi:dTDP-4-dehydrorhamnose 3,5-epimerase-like enzyme